MPKFSQHETAQRLFLSGVGGLFTLQGAGNETRVIKVLQPPEGIWSDDDLRAEVEGFLARAKIQRNAARASPFWAPVHEAAAIRPGTEGSSGGGEAMASRSAAASEPAFPPSGAFVILDRYAASAHDLIQGKLPIDNAAVRNIMTAVITGIVDLRKLENRGHGNLKSSNVLLKDRGKPASTTVHLTDPAPRSANEAGRDLIDIGRFLYELVMRREFQGGTVGPSPEWKKLGPNGEDWRKLCAALLDKNAPPDERDLDNILPQLSRWTLKPRKSRKPHMIAASAFLVIAIGGSLAYVKFHKPPVPFEHQRWEELCWDYQRWLGPVIDDFHFPKVQKQFAADPAYPANFASLLKNISKLDDFSPKKIAGSGGASYAHLAANPTDEARDPRNGSPKTQEAVEFIRAIAASLKPDQWPLLKTLDTDAKQYEARGWTKTAAEVRKMIAAAQPPAPPVLAKPEDSIPEAELQLDPIKLVENIEATVQSGKAVASINKHWSHIEDLLKQLPTTTVPLLTQLPAFAQRVPESKLDPAAAAPLDDMAKALDSLDASMQTLVEQFAAKPGRAIDFAQLANDPLAQLPDSGPTLDAYTRLAGVVPDYVVLPVDPRAAVVDFEKSIDFLDGDSIAIIRKANPGDANLAALEKNRDALRAALKQLKSGDPAFLAPIARNKPVIDAAVADARKSVDALQTNGLQWSQPYRIDPVAYIAEKRKLLATPPDSISTREVADLWKKAHRDLLAVVEKNPDQLKDWTTAQRFDTKFKALLAAYAGFEQKIPADVQGLSDLPATPANDWRRAIAIHILKDQRIAALQQVMTTPTLHWADDLPQISDPAYASFADQRRKQFDALCEDARALIHDYDLIATKIDHLQLATGEPWRALFTKWTAHPLLTAAPIAAALKPVNDRVQALFDAEKITDYPALVAATASSSAEIVLTAWRNLASAAVTETLPVLDDEDKAEGSLRTAIRSLTAAKKLDPPEAAALADEITRARPLRWQHFAESLVSEAQIELALDRLAGPSPDVAYAGVALSPAMKYNQLLYTLRQSYKAHPTEADLKPPASEFIAKVRALPDAAKNNDIAALLAAMENSMKPNADAVSAGAGPELAKWEVDKRGDVTLYYFPTRAAPRYTLEFVKLQLTEGGGGGATQPATQKTVFLCTTEMSVGLFNMVINSSPGKLAALNNNTLSSNHWFDFDSADALYFEQGPRAWKIVGGKLDLNPKWLSNIIQMDGNSKPYYPEGLPPPPAPDDAHPVQLISPWSAMYAARLLGCRLPTPEEWLDAYTCFEKTLPPASKDPWNLLGSAPAAPAPRATWRSQQDHAQAMVTWEMASPEQGVYLSDALKRAVKPALKPWRPADLPAELVPRATPGDTYLGSTLWFRKVGTQPDAAPPGAGKGAFHDLIGNVAEYVFDGPGATAVVKPADRNATPAAIDALLPKTSKNISVIGGSALSPPEIPLDIRQPVNVGGQATKGFCDVGFRLAYTAPIDTILDVLANTFKAPKYLPGK